MSLLDRLILSYLKRKNNSTITESVECIQPYKIYKLNDNVRIEFEPVMKDVWSFSLINADGKNEVGKVYKVSDTEYVSRPISVPNIEKTGKTMVDSALELLAFIGEI